MKVKAQLSNPVSPNCVSTARPLYAQGNKAPALTRSKWSELWHIFLELSKIRITLLATLSTATGFLLKTETLSLEILIPSLGIFFLACAASALNHLQERNIDALMARTKRRPLPSGKIQPLHALIFTFLFLLSGSFLLLVGRYFAAFFLGIFALFWYNLIYTPLKKKTAFAVIPGALIGSIPPLAGWASAGGNLHDPQILAVSFFLFIWQIPHFWLLLLSFHQDFELIPFPSLVKQLKVRQITRITFIWILATAVSAVLLPFFGIVQFPIITTALIVSTFWITYQAIRFFHSSEQSPAFRTAFREINIFALLILSLISLDRFLYFFST